MEWINNYVLGLEYINELWSNSPESFLNVQASKVLTSQFVVQLHFKIHRSSKPDWFKHSNSSFYLLYVCSSSDSVPHLPQFILKSVASFISHPKLELALTFHTLCSTSLNHIQNITKVSHLRLHMFSYEGSSLESTINISIVGYSQNTQSHKPYV